MCRPGPPLVHTDAVVKLDGAKYVIQFVRLGW